MTGSLFDNETAVEAALDVLADEYAEQQAEIAEWQRWYFDEDEESAQTDEPETFEYLFDPETDV